MPDAYMIRNDPTPKVSEGVSLTLRHGGEGGTCDMVAYVMKVRGGADTYTKWDGSIGTAGKGALISKEVAFTVAATQDQTLVAPEDGEYIVRRLTPTECERLQGFPDGWTDIPYKGKEHPPDTPRYKALGNSFAVPVVRMLGRRIEAFDILHYDEVGLDEE